MSAGHRHTDLYWPLETKPKRGMEPSGVRIDGLGGQLQYIAQELMTIPAETEAEFLTVGSRLNDYYDMTVKVTELSSAAAGLLSGDNVTDAVKSLKDLIGRMSQYVKDSRSLASSRDAKFMDIVDAVEMIGEQFGDYSEMSRGLRQVGVTAMVYTANMTTGDSGFMNLAKNIKGLAESIKSQSAHAYKDMKKTVVDVRATLDAVNELREKKYEDMDVILVQLNATIESLLNSHATASAALKEISAWSRGISRRIEDVVLSAQFQDITRQKFEQIKRSIDGVCGYMGIEDDSIPAQELGRFGHFCHKHAQEMIDAKDALVKAVTNILDSLRDIATSSGALAASVHEISDGKDSAGQSYLKQMGEGLDSVRDSLADIFNTEAAAIEAAAHAGGSLRNISSLLKEIEAISDDIDLVAMNAAVKSAQVGSAGSAMGVLAKNIRAVAAKSMEMAGETTSALNSLMAEISRLSEDLGVELQQTLGEAQRIEQEIEELIGSIMHMDFQVTELVGSTDEVVRSLSEDVGITVDRVVSHERTDEVVGRMVTDLRGIAMEAVSLLPHEVVLTVDAEEIRREKKEAESSETKDVEGDVEFFD